MIFGSCKPISAIIYKRLKISNFKTCMFKSLHELANFIKLVDCGSYIPIGVLFTIELTSLTTQFECMIGLH